jgi:hypothetical protein
MGVLAGWSLTGFVGSAAVVHAADGIKEIEIVIKDSRYTVTGATMTGELTSMVIRNQDVIEHGFSSPLLFDIPVRMYGEGVYFVGKGVRAYRIRPGKTITLYFSKRSTAELETQRIIFWCDLHPDMKGEFLVIETRGEVGGG